MIQRFKQYIRHVLLCNRYEDNFIQKIINIIVSISGNFRRLHFVELIVTTKCNLACKECSNLIPLMKGNSTTYSYLEVKAMIENLMRHFDVIYNLQIQGGEPLLNNDLSKIIQYILQYRNRIRNIWIISNGTIMPSVELLETLRDTKVTFAVSNYDLNKAHAMRISERCNQFNVPYRRRRATTWYHFSITEVHANKSTLKGDLIKKYNACPMRDCPSLKGNKLYLCSRLANIVDVRSGIFDDGIILNDSADNISGLFLHKCYSDNCKYCDFDFLKRCKPGVQ